MLLFSLFFHKYLNKLLLNTCMVESIKELKKICRKTENTYSKKVKVQTFPYVKFLRFFSIYFVKLGLLVRMTPNQMTFVSMLSAIIAGVFYSFASPVYWLIGSIFLILFSILDCADGEMARYYKQSSPIGRYFDLWVHGVEASSVFLGTTIGLYRLTGNVYVFALGFITIIASLLRSYSTALRSQHIIEYVMKTGDKDFMKKTKFKGEKRFIISFYSIKQIFSFFAVPYIIIFLTILDLFIKPINLLGIDIYWRMLFLYIFSIITPIYLFMAVRNTLKLQSKMKAY